jgi:hypothetical protein
MTRLDRTDLAILAHRAFQGNPGSADDLYIPRGLLTLAQDNESALNVLRAYLTLVALGIASGRLSGELTEDIERARVTLQSQVQLPSAIPDFMRSIARVRKFVDDSSQSTFITFLQLTYAVENAVSPSHAFLQKRRYLVPDPPWRVDSWWRWHDLDASAGLEESAELLDALVALSERSRFGAACTRLHWTWIRTATDAVGHVLEDLHEWQGRLKVRAIEWPTEWQLLERNLQKVVSRARVFLKHNESSPLDLVLEPLPRTSIARTPVFEDRDAFAAGHVASRLADDRLGHRRESKSRLHLRLRSSLTDLGSSRLDKRFNVLRAEIRKRGKARTLNDQQVAAVAIDILARELIGQEQGSSARPLSLKRAIRQSRSPEAARQLRATVQELTHKTPAIETDQDRLALKVVSLFYFEGVPMAQIGPMLGFKGRDVTRHIARGWLVLLRIIVAQ